MHNVSDMAKCWYMANETDHKVLASIQETGDQAAWVRYDYRLLATINAILGRGRSEMISRQTL